MKYIQLSDQSASKMKTTVALCGLIEYSARARVESQTRFTELGHTSQEGAF